MAMTKAKSKQLTHQQPGTGAVVRTVYDKLTEAVSVKDFGAHSIDEPGYSTFDSTAAIQAALNTGANVFVPKGNYLISSTLTLTTANQTLFGESFNGVNTIASQNPLSGTNISQIFTASAITMFNTGNLAGTQIRNLCFNANGVGTNGILMAQSASPLAFGIVLENVFINAPTGKALDTGYVVDSTFSRVWINGATSTPSNPALTTTGIRVGATNNTFIGCWVENCQTNIDAVGSVANWIGCTISTLYAAGRKHLKISNNLAKWTFTDCYFENCSIIDATGGYVIGSNMSFNECFLHTANPSYLFDLTGAASGSKLLVTGGRIHETSSSAVFNVPSGVTANALMVGQTTPTFTGAGAYANIGTDFYREGTFTPLIAGSTTAGTFTPQYGMTGRYTKIGRTVYFEVWLSWISGTGTGNLTVNLNDIPYASNASLPATSITVGYLNGVTFTAGKTASAVMGNGTKVVTYYQTPTGGGAVAAIPYSASGDGWLSGHFTI